MNRPFIKVVFNTNNREKQTKYKYFPSGRKWQTGVIEEFLLNILASQKQSANRIIYRISAGLRTPIPPFCMTCV